VSSWIRPGRERARVGLPWRSGRRDYDSEFAAYYAARAESLRSAAFLMCGDWHLAEDLTQTTFTKLYRVWRRIERHDAMDQYSRRVLLRAFLDERRRPWRREFATTPESDTFDTATYDPVADDGPALRAALAQLPDRQRAVLVLRYWLDLSVEQTAQAMGSPTGTVKSQSARGLAALRHLLETTDGGTGRFEPADGQGRR
jgi:RNA polymerase sigma-70 factor (sigma-E family)